MLHYVHMWANAPPYPNTMHGMNGMKREYSVYDGHMYRGYLCLAYEYLFFRQQRNIKFHWEIPGVIFIALSVEYYTRLEIRGCLAARKEPLGVLFRNQGFF